MSNSGVVAQSLTASNLVAGLLTYVVVSVVISLFSGPKYPTDIAWEGNGKGWLAGLKNTFQAFTKSQQWAQDGYENYNKKGKSYVLPSTFGMYKEIVIPRSQMQWMLEQPDSVLSTSQAHYDTLHGRYSFIDHRILKDPYHERVLHRSISRNLNAFIPSMSDEVIFNMDQVLGKEVGAWKTVNVMDLYFKIIPSITNRMLVGYPLCRNEEYLKACFAFTMDVIRNMLLLGVIPEVVRTVIGPLASLPGKYHFRQTTKFTYPLIKQRLEDIRQKDLGQKEGWEEPNDYLTWHIRLATAEGRTDMLGVKRIAQCILPLNFASIHTTSLAGHSALLDLLSADPKLGALEEIREEAERIFREDGGEWTKAGLSRMYKLDSAIRESMRLSTLGSTIAARKVVAPQGITNPEEGWHAPFGSHISCPLDGVHTDSDIHDSPAVFDPFRYSRERELYEAKSAEEKDVNEGLRLRATGMVTTSDKHFPWGHGRHACPGRFFVAHELKMIIAYLVMNFDIKHLDTRPQSKYIGRNKIPPAEASIQLKRRV